MTEAFGVRLKWLAFGFLRDSVPPLTCLKNLKKYHVTLQLKEGAAIGDCNCATVKLVHMGQRPDEGAFLLLFLLLLKKEVPQHAFNLR